MSDPSELLALDAAVEAVEEAVAAMQCALDEDLPAAVLDGLVALLEEATVALDAATVAFAGLEPPPAPVPSAFCTPEPEPLIALPVTSGHDQIVLMARDPESVFTYWEITPEGVARAKATLETQLAELVLRIYLLADGAEPEVREVPIADWLGRQTIQVDSPGIRVVTAVGFRAEGRFAHVARAAAVRLPRRSPGAGVIRFTQVKPGARPTPGPAPVVAVDSPALCGFELFHAVPIEHAAAVSDLHRVVGSNHLIPAEARP